MLESHMNAVNNCEVFWMGHTFSVTFTFPDILKTKSETQGFVP